MEITLEHDTVAWPDFARLVRPGTHRIVIPAGRYADLHRIPARRPRRRSRWRGVPSPAPDPLTDRHLPGAGTATRGPIDTVSAALLGTYGRSSMTDTVTV